MKSNVKYFFKDKNSLNKGYSKKSLVANEFEEDEYINPSVKNNKSGWIDLITSILILILNLVCMYFAYKVFNDNGSIESIIILFASSIALILSSIKTRIIRK
jgi:ABC-type multidrug transport system permease subunit